MDEDDIEEIYEVSMRRHLLYLHSAFVAHAAKKGISVPEVIGKFEAFVKDKYNAEQGLLVRKLN